MQRVKIVADILISDKANFKTREIAKHRESII